MPDPDVSATYKALTAAMYSYAQMLVATESEETGPKEETLQRIRDTIYQAPNEPLPAAQAGRIESSETGAQSPRAPSDLKDALAQLDALVGMDCVKQEIRTLVNFLSVQSRRVERQMSRTPLSLHAVFCGPPGTGKTTVARLLGHIYRAMGFLAKGHVIETDRAGLVASYVGQTSAKVDALVSQALDGVLFIDEAYALKPENCASDYGQEAIDILLKRMEDSRDRLVVIVAGYTDEMDRFLEANPGVRSRFNRYFRFEDYSPDELCMIFERFCSSEKFVLTPGARNKLRSLFQSLFAARDRMFGNGRLARNVFEKAVESQANRIAAMAPLTDELLTTLSEEDIPSTMQSGPRRESVRGAL